MSELLTETTKNFKGSTVLITGAGGFIGGHLMLKLKDLGAEVIAIDRKPSTGIHGADVSLPEQVQQIFKLTSASFGKSPEYIFHLAGQKSASLARENPADTLKTSFIGNLNILESARKLGTVKKVVLISSLAVYGLDEDQSNELLKETHSLQNDSIYSATKISTEAESTAAATGRPTLRLIALTTEVIVVKSGRLRTIRTFLD